MKIWFLSLISSRWDHPWSEHERRPPRALAGRPQEPGPAAEEDALPDRQLHRLIEKLRPKQTPIFYADCIGRCFHWLWWTIGRSRTWKRVRPLVSNDYFAQAPELACMVDHQESGCSKIRSTYGPNPGVPPCIRKVLSPFRTSCISLEWNLVTY